MSSAWALTMLGAVIVGWSIVALMVAPKRLHLLSLLAFLGGIVLAADAISALTFALGSTATVFAVLFLLAGIGGGYWTAAAALASLGARTAGPRRHHTPDVRPAPTVVLVSCAPSDAYSIRDVAVRHRILTEDGAEETPDAVLPLRFLEQKARYRSIGGRIATSEVACALAERLEEELATSGRSTKVALAGCTTRPRLARVLADARDRGARKVFLVSLDPTSALLAGETRRVTAAVQRDGGPEIVFAPSVWDDRRLAERLCERVLEACTDVPLGRVGVVIAAEGRPLALGARPAEDDARRFTQRVRTLLDARGIAGDRVRMGWLRWETPDVTEALRHVAALGCERIVVVPATEALPTLGTSLDLEDAVHLARLPHDAVSVAVLPPWGVDPVLIAALSDAARAADPTPYATC